MLPVLLNENKHKHRLKRRWGGVGLHRVKKIKYICVSKPKKEYLWIYQTKNVRYGAPSLEQKNCKCSKCLSL